MHRAEVMKDLKSSRDALAKCRDRIEKARRKVELLEARVEHGAYPAYQTESFRNDDLMERAAHLRELERLEDEERRLEDDVRAWQNTLEGL